MEKFSVTISEAQNKLTFEKEEPGDPEADLDTDNLDQGDTKPEKEKHSLTQKSLKSNVPHQKVEEDTFVIFTDYDLKTSDNGKTPDNRESWIRLGNDVEKSEIENFNVTMKANVKLPQGYPGEAKF